MVRRTSKQDHSPTSLGDGILLMHYTLSVQEYELDFSSTTPTMHQSLGKWMPTGSSNIAFSDSASSQLGTSGYTKMSSSDKGTNGYCEGFEDIVGCNRQDI